MHSRVHVVSTGIISALGESVTETIASFKNHHSGIAAIRHLNTRHSHIFPCGEVKVSNRELAEKHGLDSRLTRTILLSYHAAIQALEPFSVSELNKHRVAFISASTIGGMDKTENFFEEYQHNSESGDLHDVQYHDCGKPTDHVFDLLGLDGFATTISTACSSSANAIMLGARMIKAGKADIVIAGGVDALSRFTLNGFNSLMIVDNKQCRPLDQSREGLNLGEGAAYLVLMSDAMVEKFDVPSRCVVSGYANTNDSFHQTALSDDGNGPWLAMREALQSSGIKPGQIDYINMHGTGTRNNDSAEGRALSRIFGDKLPPLSSTKSFTGHTLGASGAIEALFATLSLTQGIIFPNFSFETAMDEAGLQPQTKFSEGNHIRNVLSNSFGFGGNCTSLIFSAL